MRHIGVCLYTFIKFVKNIDSLDIVYMCVRSLWAAKGSEGLISVTVQIMSPCDTQMALQSLEVETSSSPLRNKETSRMTSNFTIAGHAYSNFVHGFRFYLPYLETAWRLTWIVMAPGRQCKFHALCSFQRHISSWCAPVCVCVCIVFVFANYMCFHLYIACAVYW